MAVPKRRTTSAKKGSRRSHDALGTVQMTVCPSCKKPVRQHQACDNCGNYRGRKVLKVG